MISVTQISARERESTPIPIQTTLQYMDSTQRFISDSWLGINHGMDTFFSDTTLKREDNESEITLAFGGIKKERSEENFYFDIRLRVHLPRVSDKLSATIEKERDRITEVRTNEANQEAASRESSYTANVNVSVIRSVIGQIDISTGIRFTLPLDPFIRANLVKNIETKIVNIHLGQYINYYRQDGLSEFTRLSFFREINSKWSFHQNNVLSWTQQDDEFILRNSLSFNQKISDKTTFVYAVGANAKLSPTYYYDRYDYSVSARRQLHRNTIFGSLTLGAEFDKEREWDINNYIATRVEIAFR